MSSGRLDTVGANVCKYPSLGDGGLSADVRVYYG